MPSRRDFEIRYTKTVQTSIPLEINLVALTPDELSGDTIANSRSNCEK
jgi:hypothetical protein